MFLWVDRSLSRYDRAGEQRARGLFLILFEDSGHPRELRAAVRNTTMHQFGHFMMGFARIGKHRITLSGTYGNDGLPRNAPPGLWDLLVPVPAHLYEAWAKGGGWNGPGSEGPAMREWARLNMVRLRTAGTSKVRT